MLKKRYHNKASEIPHNWRSCCVKLWEEDDVNYEGKEHTSTAFARISNIRSEAREPIHEIDEGDQTVYFYRPGWVKAINCDGGWVGVLVDGLMVH